MHHDLANYVFYYVLQMIGIRPSWGLWQGWGYCQEGVLGDWRGDKGGMCYHICRLRYWLIAMWKLEIL